MLANWFGSCRMHVVWTGRLSHSDVHPNCASPALPQLPLRLVTHQLLLNNGKFVGSRMSPNFWLKKKFSLCISYETSGTSINVVNIAFDLRTSLPK
jgi:hypothetical protein